MHLHFDIKDHSEWTKTIIFIKNAQFISACAEVRILLDYISRDYNNTKKSHYPLSHNEKSYSKR